MTTVQSRTREIETLHRKYAGVLFDLCVRILKDRARAEDAVQECFLCAWRGLDTFTFGDSYLPWLYRIATNACLKLIRTDKRKELYLMTDLIMNTASKQSNQESRLIASATIKRLEKELDERTKEILISHYIAGMDQGQIAQSLGISRRAVVKRLTRMRTIAAALLQEDGHD